MNRRFFHVSFNFEGEKPPVDELKEAFDKALDWVGYAPNCYLIYTVKDETTWYRRLKKIAPKDASIFVIEVNMENKDGWLPKSVWAWINKDRSE